MTGIGSRVFGFGCLVLGMVELVYGDFSDVWLPVPAHIPGYHPLAFVSAGLLVLAGIAINFRRTRGMAALILAAFFAAWIVLLQAPLLLAKPAGWGRWQALAETSVMGLGGLLVYARSDAVDPARAARIAGVTQRAFGVCLLIFGVSHFVYAKFTASLVPAWLPPSRLFWTYATGAAQIAAGLAVLSGVQARLAAVLLTVMYAGFSLLVHVPSIVANPASQDNWAENGINLIFVGAAWVLAEALSKARAYQGTV